VTLFLAAAIFVLAGAIVLLFAMLGELTSRLPHLQVGYRQPFVRPLEEAIVGARPLFWPDPLTEIGHDHRSALIMALSTACATCENVAMQLAAGYGVSDDQELAVVVSTGSRAAGTDFIRRNGLGHLTTYIDERGDWLINSFGVKTSPSALVLRDGALESAFVFGDVDTLRREVDRREMEVVSS
jgi:hypothetical protein